MGSSVSIVKSKFRDEPTENLPDPNQVILRQTPPPRKYKRFFPFRRGRRAAPSPVIGIATPTTPRKLEVEPIALDASPEGEALCIDYTPQGAEKAKYTVYY